MAETTPVRIENDAADQLRDVAYQLTGAARKRITLSDALRALLTVANAHQDELLAAVGGSPEPTQ